MAAGVPLDAMPERIARRVGIEQPLSTADLHAALADAAQTANERALLPPAEAAFVDGFGGIVARAALTSDKPLTIREAVAGARDGAPIRPSNAELEDLRALSKRLLGAYLADEVDSPDFPRPKEDESHGIALRYLEALLRQEEIVAKLGDLDPETSPLHCGPAQAERARIDDFLLYRGVTGQSKTLDSLIMDWQRFVERLESEPDRFVYEVYEDRLIRRDVLEDAIGLIDPHMRDCLERHVRPLDDRFFAATRAAAEPIGPRSPWKPRRWWWHRHPRRLHKNFVDRLS
jgi:hypothetical protein